MGQQIGTVSLRWGWLATMFCTCRCTSHPLIGEDIKGHISRPHFLSPRSRESDLVWIFMGAPGPGASMHVSNNVEKECLYIYMHKNTDVAHYLMNACRCGTLFNECAKVQNPQCHEFMPQTFLGGMTTGNSRNLPMHMHTLYADGSAGSLQQSGFRENPTNLLTSLSCLLSTLQYF